MHPFVLIPLLTCVGAAVMASAIWGRDPRHPTNRLAAALLLVDAFWALCEVFENTAGSAAAALPFARLAGFGFVWFAPLSIHLFMHGHRGVAFGNLERWLPHAYACTAALAILYVASPWFVVDAEPTPWGWSPVFGPAFPIAAVWATACPVGLVILGRRHRFAVPAVWRRQIAPLNLAVLVVVAFAWSTEVVLPFWGVPVPRLGSVSIAVVGGFILLSIYRWGYSVVTPGNLASEVLEAFPDGIALLRRDGRIRFANENLARLVGCNREALVGTPLRQFVRDSRFDPLESVDELECELRDASDRLVPVSVSSSPLREKRGTTIGQVVAVRDLTRVVELRNRLVTTGRLAAVGELAAAITHEINNPISFVRSNLGLLERHWESIAKALEAGPVPAALAGAADEGRELIGETRGGADRVAAIARDVRRFSQAEYRERESVDLNRLCEEALRMAIPSLREGVNVVRSYAPLPAVSCAPHELVQVFLNLLTNAAHAVGAGGTIRAVTERDGDHAVVRVEDDGAGIPPEVVERVFDPFFTTKPVGEGTGLGLAISHQIVRNHGGDLSVESSRDGGTCFQIRLPLRPAPLPSAAGEEPDP